MKKVAKLVLVDRENTYLLLYRSNHPTFGCDPDLPGGTLEEGESITETVLREAEEEIGVIIEDVREIYSGLDYSKHGTHKSLFVARIDERPIIKMSWEHTNYEWLSKTAFLEKAKNANDTYMHMVYEVLKNYDIDS